MCGIPTPPWRILYSLLSYNNCGCLAFCDSNFTATSWNDKKYNISPHFTAPVTRISPITVQINDKFEHRGAASDVQHLTSWEFSSPFATNTFDLTLKFSTKMLTNVDVYTACYLSIRYVDGQVYVTERSRSDFSDKLVFSTDNEFGFRATAARHVHQMTISTWFSFGNSQ